MVKRGVEVVFGDPAAGSALANLHLDDDRHGRWHTAFVPGMDQPVAFRVAREPDGRLACTGLLIGGVADPVAEPTEVTASSLRRVSPVALVEAFAHAARGLDTLASERPAFGGLVAEATDVPRRRIRKRTLRAGMAAPKRRDLEDLADAYRAALADPTTARKPVTAVAARLGISRHTAQRWRARAIEAGLLPAGIDGRDKR